MHESALFEALEKKNCQKTFEWHNFGHEWIDAEGLAIHSSSQPCDAGGQK